MKKDLWVKCMYALVEDAFPSTFSTMNFRKWAPFSRFAVMILNLWISPLDVNTCQSYHLEVVHSIFLSLSFTIFLPLSLSLSFRILLLFTIIFLGRILLYIFLSSIIFSSSLFVFFFLTICTRTFSLSLLLVKILIHTLEFSRSVSINFCLICS